MKKKRCAGNRSPNHPTPPPPLLAARLPPSTLLPLAATPVRPLPSAPDRSTSQPANQPTSLPPLPADQPATDTATLPPSGPGCFKNKHSKSSRTKKQNKKKKTPSLLPPPPLPQLEVKPCPLSPHSQTSNHIPFFAAPPP